MKVKELNGNWKAIHLADRTILKVDLGLFSKSQVEDLGKLEVEPMDAKGHYKALY